jgi:hypothetical protein
MKAARPEEQRWIEFLSGEDLTFLKRFLLASGSLKELARSYGISYPTVRQRLDRLIAKVSVVERQRDKDRFERMARGLCADGQFDTGTLRALLEAHREEMKGQDDASA